jgi:hypothetical protein
MSGNLISLAAEALVAVLLIVTIGYCILLNSRLKRLRSDESDLRATISELVTATEIAERAIGGLKSAAVDCDRTLATRMREAEHFSIEVAREIAEGQKVLKRIKQITAAVRKVDATGPSTETSEMQHTPEGAVATVVKLPDLDIATDTGFGIRASLARLEEAVTAKAEIAGVSQPQEPRVEVPVDEIRTASVAPSRAASRIEELRVMADQARERLKELRKVNTEKAA